MSLKRKASFSCDRSHGRGLATDFDMQMEDVSRHLNSRTRKRFRDNRPDEQTIYTNTLRLLYQAQKEPIVSTPSNEPALSDPPPSEPEALDPRQQTLLKFFQPIPARSSLPRVDTKCYSTNNSLQHDIKPVQSVTMEFEYDQSISTSGSSTPASTASTDMDVDMDADTNMNYSSEGRSLGGIGWMR